LYLDGTDPEGIQQSIRDLSRFSSVREIKVIRPLPGQPHSFPLALSKEISEKK
jgi:hypothetical protein